jgi:hypothetical protein
MRLCAAYKVFNAEPYLACSLRSIYDVVDRIVVFVSTTPWNGPIVPPDGTEALVRSFPDPMNKIRFVVRDFRYAANPSDASENECLEMNALLDYIRTECPDVTHYLYIDADEVYAPEAITGLRRLLTALPAAGQVHCAWRCYWKSFRYWIDPMEPTLPLVAFRIGADTRFTGIRATNMAPRVVVSPGHLYLHHFSYALPAELISRKLQAWSHCEEVVDDWFDRVWLAWDTHREMEDLHPVAPPHFKRAVPADAAALPAVMKTHPFYGKDIV